MREHGARDYAPSQKELEHIVANNEARLQERISDLSRSINSRGTVDEFTGLNRTKLKDLAGMIYDSLTRAKADSVFGQKMLEQYPSFYKVEPGKRTLVLDGTLKDKLIGKGAPYGKGSVGFKNAVVEAILSMMMKDPSRKFVTDEGVPILRWLAYSDDRLTRETLNELIDQVIYNLAGHRPVMWDEERGMYVHDPGSSGFNASRWLEQLKDNKEAGEWNA